MKYLKWSVPISEKLSRTDEKTQKRELVVAGDAIHETTTRNNHKFIAEELSRSAQSLVGKPLLKDHIAVVDNIVGRVSEAKYDPNTKSLKYRAVVKNPKIIEMIEDGLIQNVSVGAMAKELALEEGSEDVFVVKGIEFTELSFVAIPADPNANVMLSNGLDFANAVYESFKEKVEERTNMDSQKILELERQVETLKQKLDEKTQVKEKDSPADYSSYEDCVSQNGKEKCDMIFGKETEALTNQITEKVTKELSEKLEKQILEKLANENAKGKVSASESQVQEDVLKIGNRTAVREKDGSYTIVQHGPKGGFTRVKDHHTAMAIMTRADGILD